MKIRPTTFNYFNRLQRRKLPRFPISDHITNKDHEIPKPTHENERKIYDPKDMGELSSSAAEQAR